MDKGRANGANHGMKYLPALSTVLRTGKHTRNYLNYVSFFFNKFK